MLSSPLPILPSISLSLREKPDRAGETWEGPLRQNRGVCKVYVLRQVSAAVARGDGWAGHRGCSLSGQSGFFPLPTASPPLPLKFCSHILKALNFNFL